MYAYNNKSIKRFLNRCRDGILVDKVPGTTKGAYSRVYSVLYALGYNTCMHLPNSQAFLHLILTSVGFLRNLFTDIVERYHDADELDIFRVPCSDREENSYKKALLAMINRAACLVTFAFHSPIYRICFK